jgi:hypothetical protein
MSWQHIGSQTAITRTQDRHALDMGAYYDHQSDPAAHTAPGLDVSLRHFSYLTWSASTEIPDFAKYYIYGVTSAAPADGVLDTITVVDFNGKRHLLVVTEGSTHYYRMHCRRMTLEAKVNIPQKYPLLFPQHFMYPPTVRTLIPAARAAPLPPFSMAWIKPVMATTSMCKKGRTKSSLTCPTKRSTSSVLKEPTAPLLTEITSGRS